MVVLAEDEKNIWGEDMRIWKIIDCGINAIALYVLYFYFGWGPLLIGTCLIAWNFIDGLKRGRYEKT